MSPPNQLKGKASNHIQHSISIRIKSVAKLNFDKYDVIYSYKTKTFFLSLYPNNFIDYDTCMKQCEL